MEPIQLFTYWQKMDQANPDRLTAYVYRTWPVIDKRILDPKAYLYIAKEAVAYPEPKDWRSEMLHRYGSGNYKIILTDDAMSKGIGQTLVTDLRDPEYPPVIENLDELVMDDPTNQSFLENLRQKGILPGQESDNDMAAGEMAQALTGTIDKLTTKLTERQREPTPPAPPQSATDAAQATVKMAAEVFKQGIDLGKESVTAQADAKVQAAEAQFRAADPMASFDTLTRLISVVKDLQPKQEPAPATAAGSTAELTAMVNSFMGREAALQGKIMEIMQAQMTSMEARHVAAAQAAAAVQVQVSAPQKEDFFANLDRLVAAKDKLQALFGGGGGGDDDGGAREEKTPMWMQLAQAALTGLPTVATSLLAMSYNMAVAKTGNGAPILPAPGPGPGDAPNPDQPSMPGAPGAPGMAVNPGHPQPQRGEGVYAMLKLIEEPLLRYLNEPTKGGEDFAAALMDFQGRLAYDRIRGLGKDTIMALLNSYPPIGSVLAQIPQRADEFIDDFLNADAILAGEETEGEGEGEGEREGEGEGEVVAGANPVVIDLPPLPQPQTRAKAKVKKGAKPANV